MAVSRWRVEAKRVIAEALAKLRPDQSLVYLRSWNDIKDLFEGISKILEYLKCS